MTGAGAIAVSSSLSRACGAADDLFVSVASTARGSRKWISIDFGLMTMRSTNRSIASRSETFKTLGRSLPGLRHGLGKRRYRAIARCGPRDDCREHPGWGKRERRQQANMSFHLALVLRDLGERLNATRYEIVDPSPCFDDRQQDGVACLRFQHCLAARLMQNPFH